MRKNVKTGRVVINVFCSGLANICRNDGGVTSVITSVPFF